ncbi:5636_t:CDS:2, partial [Funneliformis geosporum]
HLKIPGCVAIDVRPCFKKFYPKAEKSSLSYYLRECNLDNKVDLPIHRMNKYYERALKETNITTAEHMREVAKYCIINALSYQRLMVKRMKVRNFLSAGVWQKGILTSTIPYFASLYPSLIMTYNLSPDKIILSRERAESLKKSGKRLHEINFKYNGRDVLAWSIEHENQAEMKGLYPKVLEELLIKRNSLKRRLAPLNDRKEELEKEISLAEARGENVTDALKSEYSSVSFIDACLDAKSFALKVYMNTFYSEAGNSRSPFFLRALADGVTSAGHRNIKLIADLVRSKEEYWSKMVNIFIEVIERLRDKVNNFLRNDNESSYLKMAYEEVLFLVVFTGKKKYYSIAHRREPNFNNKLFIQGVEIVKRGQSKYFREIGKKVMDKSMRLDNTRILHRIVEDVLKETINGILQINFNEVVKTAVWRPNKNNKSIQHFISRMRDRHTHEGANAKRRIKKGLIPEPYLYEIPEPGERFEYIVVENDSSQKVGDKMEYPEVVRRLGKKIDISYYLKTVVGLCARFINYDEIFQPSSEIVLEALKKLKDGNKV